MKEIMDEQIINLINMALADGEVNEKERSIILKKAITLGLDQDEVEMVLDGKIALMKKEANLNNPIIEKHKSQKQGDVKKCPSCGAPIKSFQTKCSECEHEFRNIEVNTSIKNLFNELKNIKKSNCKDEDGDFDEEEYDRLRAEIVRNFTVPSTKEDLIEFAAKSIAEIKISEVEHNELNCAWESKAEETLDKLHVFSTSDKTIAKTIERLEINFKRKQKESKKAKTKNLLGIIIMMSISLSMGYFFFTFILSLFGYKFWPFI